jgi:hypothetical protein
MQSLTRDPAGPLHIPDLGKVRSTETGLEETYEILQYSRPRQSAVTPSNILNLFVAANQSTSPLSLPPLVPFEIKPRTDVSPDDPLGWALVAGENLRPVHGEVLQEYIDGAQRGQFPTSGGLIVEADMALSSRDSTMALFSKIQFHVQRALSMNVYPVTFMIWPKMLENIIPKIEEMAQHGWIIWNPVSLQGSLIRDLFSNLFRGAFSFVVYTDLEGGFRDTKRPLPDRDQKTLTKLWNQEA